MSAEKKIKQLQMVWPAGKPRPRIQPIPRGYALRTFRPGDSREYVRVMTASGFKAWRPNLDPTLQSALNRGIFFVVHERSGRVAATAAAQHSPRRLHPFGAQLGWVGADPRHRGNGLGFVVSAAATRRMIEAGYENIFLLTDDWRLPAIRVYLKLGYVPFLFARGMEGRWKKVCRALGVAFESTNPLGRDMKPAKGKHG